MTHLEPGLGDLPGHQALVSALWLSARARTVRGMDQNARYETFHAKQLDERIEEFVLRDDLIMLSAGRARRR